MNNLHKLIFLAVIAFSLFINVPTQAHDGHDDEDIVLNDLGDLGKVDFSISCDEEAQTAINTGVGLLHHMMYAQAELHFGEWMEKTPDCAMLYWGYSMSLFHPLWPDKISDDGLTRGQAALAKTTDLKTTQREKFYLQAASQYYKDWDKQEDKVRIANWVAAQALVYEEYPQDIDAAAFYALSQLVVASKKDLSFSQNKIAGELLGKLREISPTHPGAIHYSIHAYDNPPLAELAVDAARAYDKIAPDVPHALHMPSHIFVRLGMWDDVSSWNTRSAKAALKYPTNGATSMHYVHAIDYLLYGQLQMGEGDKALQSLSKVDTHYPIQDTFPAAYALATMPARIALEQGNWQQASDLKTQTPNHISWQKFPQVEAITYFAKGIGAARSGDVKSAQENVAQLDNLYKAVQKSSPGYWAPLVESQRMAVRAWIEFETGDKDKALVQLRKAADIEDAIDKNPVTPGAVLPTRELLADMLFSTEDYSGALEAYKASLAISPNRLYSISGVERATVKLGK